MATFIMRWNPGISSANLDNYMEARNTFPGGFRWNWSIFDWEKAKAGDNFYMLRVGEGANGIVYEGEFLSDPYEGSDWAGTDKKRHYVDIAVWNPADADKPWLTSDELEKVLPSIDWRKGHSGELISKEDADKLYILMLEAMAKYGSVAYID